MKSSTSVLYHDTVTEGREPGYAVIWDQRTSWGAHGQLQTPGAQKGSLKGKTSRGIRGCPWIWGTLKTGPQSARVYPDNNHSPRRICSHFGLST